MTLDSLELIVGGGWVLFLLYLFLRQLEIHGVFATLWICMTVWNEEERKKATREHDVKRKVDLAKEASARHSIQESDLIYDMCPECSAPLVYEVDRLEKDGHCSCCGGYIARLGAFSFDYRARRHVVPDFATAASTSTPVGGLSETAAAVLRWMQRSLHVRELGKDAGAAVAELERTGYVRRTKRLVELTDEGVGAQKAEIERFRAAGAEKEKSEEEDLATKENVSRCDDDDGVLLATPAAAMLNQMRGRGKGDSPHET